MKTTAVSLIYILAIILSVIGFLFTQAKPFLFAPLVLGLIGVMFFPRRMILNFILIYVCFDGMIKVLSGYQIILHVAADIIVIIVVIRRLLEIATITTERAFRIAPFALLFATHVLWVTVEILNPYGVGLIPGIAAYKVYLSFVLLYFFAYDFLEEKADFYNLALLAIILMGLQVVLSIYQFNVGINSVLSMSQNYMRSVGLKFAGLWFRPFGTGSVPGVPSVWIFLTAPLVVAMFFENKKLFFRLSLVFLSVLSIYTLVVCQVRASIIKAFIGAMAASILINLKRPAKFVLGLFVAVGVYFSLNIFLFLNDPRMAVVQERLETIYNIDKLSKARQLGAISSIYETWSEAPFGIGLSRVGAASGPFIEKIKENKFFGVEFAFADNLYKALAVELGIPGTVLYLLFVFLPFIYIFRRVINQQVPSEHVVLVSGALGLCLASIVGYGGSEGALYLPECAYFWIFLGAAMKFSSVHLDQRSV